MENKNVVVALVLMLVVWLGYNFFFPPSQGPISSGAPEAQSTTTLESPGALVPSPTTASVEPVAPVTPETATSRELVVETDLYRAVFSSTGAKLKVFELKGYKESADKDSSVVSMVTAGPERLGTLRTAGSDGLSLAADAPYVISVSADSLKISGKDTAEVVFRTVSASGLVVEKLFVFRADSYDFDCTLRVTNAGAAPVSGNISLSLVHPWDDSQAGSRMEFVGPATLVADELQTDKVDDLAKEPRSYSQDIVWSAFVTKYFMSAVIPLDKAAEKLLVQRNGEAIENVFSSPHRTLQPGDSFALNYLLYYGPKDLDILKVVDHELARAIDFGFFAPIARPLLHILKFFYGFIGNYGVAIILLTTIIKALFWPLTQKSYSSMKAMQKLQPEMVKIREKYKNDRERLNRETMELYKTHRVNPLGGCLPMLVQIPVFFALYKVLLDAIELRHAPFVLWLTDLSAKDPYYVTPLIMGATMFLQQKMTPSNLDPTQAKMFMIMPVVFTFLFLNFPSGLVLYWLVNNVLTIGQQYLINRKA